MTSQEGTPRDLLASAAVARREENVSPHAALGGTLWFQLESHWGLPEDA